MTHKQKPTMRLVPYYTSYTGYLTTPSGKELCLGELPKWLARGMGVDWGQYVRDVRRRQKQYKKTAHRTLSQARAMADVFLHYLTYNHPNAEYGETYTVEEVIQVLESSEPWDIFA